MSRLRIINSDREITAVKFNMKEQRCLQKNLVTLDAEASYSVKLLDMDNRGMKVFYRRFRDKVCKIKSHLKVNEISTLKDMEAEGRLSPPINTANTTASLRIQDAEKRLKLQGRDHLRKTKSAVTSRSLRLSRDMEKGKESNTRRSFDSHLNVSSESLVHHRPSTIAWEDKAKTVKEGRPSRASSETSRQNSHSEISKQPPIKSEDTNNNIPVIILSDLPTMKEDVPFEKPKCTGISIVHGEEPKVENDTRRSSVFQQISSMTSLSHGFIETGNSDSPRILNKTPIKLNSAETGETTTPEAEPSRTSSAKSDESKVDEKVANQEHAEENDQQKTENKIVSNKTTVNGQEKRTKQTQQYTRTCQRKNCSSPTKKNTSLPPRKRVASAKKTKEPAKVEIKQSLDTKVEDSKESSSILESESIAAASIEAEPSGLKVSQSTTSLAVPRLTKSKSFVNGPEKKDKGNKTDRSRSHSVAAGKIANVASNMGRQYSCHNYDKNTTKLLSRMSISISDGLFCLGDDPYEERRQLLIMDEHNRFVILLHKKEEYLKRIEEYIRKQLEETAHLTSSDSKKKSKTAKDIWDELKNCRYLRNDGDEEHIDLSTVVTLASEQLKNKGKLTYKPLFQKQSHVDTESPDIDLNDESDGSESS